MYVSYENMVEVNRVVSGLVPGYYRRAIDPFEALENQQGNCFTNAVIGALALSHCFAVEASMAWSPRLHATPRGDMFLASKSRDTVRDKNIAHIELIAPRAVDQYDVLGIAWGHKVTDGKPDNGDVFEKHDRGGIIQNYNFAEIDPDNEDVADASQNDDPMLMIVAEGEIIPTEYGREIGVESMDWRDASNEYLAALGLEPIIFDALEEMFDAKFIAWRDWCTQVQPANN